MMNFSLYIFVCFVFSKCCSEIVEVENGYLESTESVSKNGREFLEFRGIPFAAPPVGELRLMPPQPPESWSGVRKSTSFPECLQPELPQEINSKVIGKEDCLYLNVFTPKSSDRGDDKLPVLVFIFGGGYYSGNADSYSPKYFMDKNVTLVTLNYRLGALGFLSAVDDIIPGNYGFKDQVLALKWVQKNIEVFGGDPQKVTIFGHSSGAASVHYHMLSPMSKDLFHGAILMSGSGFSPWAFYTQNYTKVSAASLLYTTGCYFENTTASLECLKKLEPEVFVKHVSRLYMWKYDPRILYRASIENPTSSDNQPVFLDKRPTEKAYENDVPCIFGHSTGDGILLAKPLLENNSAGAKQLNEYYEFLLPLITQYLFMSNNSEQYARSGSAIKQKYFGDEEIGKKTARQLVKLFTESLISFPLTKTVFSTREKPSYLYLYNHISKHFFPVLNDLGVNHGDELYYLFYSEQQDLQMTSEDREVSNKLIDYWYNFAKYGDPNGESEDKFWTPVSKEQIGYLEMKTQNFTMEEGIFEQNLEFWNSLPTGI